ncbi:uncharacterized protein LOC126998713 [Eriocheir sinensis]|uniref:uncharacterized protein LOC126998713 n=1 Tax=Eriocheir sinensis TaxID=95602 RepID=UPI0021C7FF20|nr:uncharacterized protein LOC126998713 [Eriocheir sinensis]
MMALSQPACFASTGVTWAIKITRLEVPTPLAVGDGGWLECEWKDEGDHVYALKWYVSGEEFYRWTPLETPAIKTFPSPHFEVDSRDSHRGRVRIRNVTVSAGGKYRCEISGEAPKFKTSFATADMTVVDLPDSRPRIEGNEAIPYQLHQTITINCSSHDALPAPSLTFYINDQPVDPEWEDLNQVLVNETSGLETSHKSLHFRLQPSMVPLGLLQVKCVASYPQLYWESSEKTFRVLAGQSSGLPLGSQGFVLQGEARRSEASMHFLSVLLLAPLIMR